MPRIYDVTVPLSAAVQTFHGDPRFEMDFAHRITEGKPYNVASLKMGAHSGTHVDAPYHFIEDGITVDQLALDVLMGPARVHAVSARDRIRGEDLERLGPLGSRVLFKTRNSGTLRQAEFREDFVALDPGAAERLVAAGVKLVGVDYLSVEAFGSQDFASHHVLLGAGVVIVEGLDLSEVPPGDYDLACLPLRIAGADGSPARVVLTSR